MRTLWSRVGLASILLAGVHTGLAAGPQDSQEQRPHVFSSRTEMVVVNVSVLDRSGFVSGLPKDAFTVYDNGQPQPVTLFQNEDNPVTVGLVIDCSGSMTRKRSAVIAASVAFARSSHPDDEMFTTNFN